MAETLRPLNSDDSDDEAEIQEEWTKDFLKNQERKRLIKRIVKLCGKDDGAGRPLNVVIIGPAGVGKSAFINTLAAALGGDRWREYAYSGSHGSIGGQITVFTTSFDKCCKQDQYKDALLPTLIDVAGFHDQAGEEFIELLRIVFYGRLPEGESLAEAAQYYRDRGLEGLRTKYNQNNEKLKVDRVLFLTSSTQQVPENLIHCVVQAARPPGTKDNPKKRTIPLFGVMLKYDKVVSNQQFEKMKSSDACDVVSKEEYEKRELKFINALGLAGSKHRFLRCSNYCDDVDKDNKRVDSVIPDLDIPILRFFTQVADPVFRVLNEGESYLEGSTPKEPEVQENTAEPSVAVKETIGGNSSWVMMMMLISIEAIIVAFILQALLSTPVDTAKLKAVCKFMEHQNGSSIPQMGDICEDLRNPGFLATYSYCIAIAALILIRIGATVATARIFRR